MADQHGNSVVPGVGVVVLGDSRVDKLGFRVDIVVLVGPPKPIRLLEVRADTSLEVRADTSSEIRAQTAPELSR